MKNTDIVKKRKPVGRNLFLKEVIKSEPEDKKECSIILPEKLERHWKSKYKVYEVVGVGGEVKTVKLNSHVIISRHAGIKIILNDEALLVAHEADVLGVVEDEILYKK